MDTIVRPPETPPDRPAATGTNRRRWPRRVSVALIIVAVAAVVTGLAWVSNIEPLGPGHSFFPINDPGIPSSTRDVFALGVTGKVNTVRVQPGTTFRYDVTIMNSGRLPVSVKAIGTPERPLPRKAIAMSADHYPGGNPRTLLPFSPFHLDPSEEAFIEMEVRVPEEACLDRESFYGWDSEPITYTVLGITRHSDVDTWVETRVKGTGGPTPGCSAGN